MCGKHVSSEILLCWCRTWDFAESINISYVFIVEGPVLRSGIQMYSDQHLSNSYQIWYTVYTVTIYCIYHVSIYIYIYITEKGKPTIQSSRKKYQTKLHFFSVSLHSDRPCHNGPPVNLPRCACWHLPCRGNSRSSEPCFGRGTWTGIRVSRHQTFWKQMFEDSHGLWLKGVVHCAIFFCNLSLNRKFHRHFCWKSSWLVELSKVPHLRWHGFFGGLFWFILTSNHHQSLPTHYESPASSISLQAGDATLFV